MGNKGQNLKKKTCKLVQGKIPSFVIRKRGWAWELKTQKVHLSIFVVLIQGEITP